LYGFIKRSSWKSSSHILLISPLSASLQLKLSQLMKVDGGKYQVVVRYMPALRGSYSRLLSGDMHPKCLLVLSVHGIANEGMLYVHGFSYPAASFINYSIIVNPEVTIFLFFISLQADEDLQSESKICIFFFP
jgi:hypothetical protein